MFSMLWNIAAFVVALGVLITVHELGHFLVARFCGVHVERFSIGFGKSIWSYVDCNGTEFVIAMIPLGGYVKMLDDRIESLSSKSYYYTFNSKTIGQRFSIIAAGLVSNFIFAVFAYWLAFIVGIPSIRPVIGEIDVNSVAANAEIEPNMELKAIDGIETSNWDEVRLQLINKIGDDQAIVSVLSLGSSNCQKKVLNLKNWSFDLNKDDPIVALGIHPYIPQIETVLAKVQDCYAAQKAGLQVGDRIVKVNGHPLTKWMTFVNLVRDNLGKPMVVEIERQGFLFPLTIIPDKNPVGNKDEGFIGVFPKIIPLPDKYKTILQYGPFSALFKAIEKTWQLMKLTVNMLGKLITGEIKLTHISGPLSIAKGAGISANLGIIHYLMFLALISVNLGIINLLPLPVLDGGRLLFLVIEKLKGSPIPEQIQDVSYRISSILLVLLMGFVLFNDFSRL